MADYITKAQYEELEDLDILDDTDEFNKLLEKYTGVTARPYTSYAYYDAMGNCVGDSDGSTLDDLLQSAYVEVRDG